MKYVKTKDGCITKGNFELGKTILTVWGEEIITKENSADTISKLCDGFLVISEEYNEPHYEKELIDTNALDFENNWKPYGNGKVLDKTCQKLIDAIIYGVIWTTGEHGEPILKSIAKMNNDGELELL